MEIVNVCRTNLTNHLKKLRKPLQLSHFWKCANILPVFFLQTKTYSTEYEQ